MSKSIKIIFTLSLLLNLVLVGIAGGCLWKRGGPPMPFGETSAETQALFKRHFEANRGAMRADIDTIRASRKALEPIITAENFDRDAYDAEIDKVLKTRDKMGHRRADILGDILAEMPHADREKVAHKILSKLTDDRPRGPRRDHDGKPHGAPPVSPPAE